MNRNLYPWDGRRPISDATFSRHIRGTCTSCASPTLNAIGLQILLLPAHTTQTGFNNLGPSTSLKVVMLASLSSACPSTLREVAAKSPNRLHQTSIIGHQISLIDRRAVVAFMAFKRDTVLYPVVICVTRLAEQRSFLLPRSPPTATASRASKEIVTWGARAVEACMAVKSR